MATYTTRFLLQDHFKTLTVGASPYLPSVRQTEMLLQNKIGKSGLGFQLTPRDQGGDAAYHKLAQNYFEKIRNWNSTQDSILPETKELSIDLAERLYSMLDYKGRNFSNPTATSIEGEIQNLEIMKQMPPAILKRFQSSQVLEDLGNIGVSNALDHQRTSLEGMQAIELMGELAGGKVGQAIKKSAYALDVTDSKASKYLTGEFKNLKSVDEGQLKQIESTILDKVRDLNDSFNEVGVAFNATTKSVKDLFKGSAYEGKTTTVGASTSMEAFGKHVLANFIGLANLKARNPNDLMSHNMFVFQEPIGSSGVTAIITLTPDTRRTKKPLSVIPTVTFKKVAPDGVVAASSIALGAAYNQFASRNNLDNIAFLYLDDVALANIAVQTSDRVAAIGGVQDVSIGELVDDSTAVIAEVVQTMTTTDIAKSLHAQITNWAKNPDNRKKFERWYNHAFQRTDALYALWRRKEIAFHNAYIKGQGDAWMYKSGQNTDSSMDIRPNMPRLGEQAVISTPGDHGIWNEKPSQWLNKREAQGLQISPFLISRNKYVSKWGREFKA